MFPDLNFVDYVMILLGALLLCKRVAEMERYHDLKIIILTSIFGTVLMLFFLAFISTFDNWPLCEPGPDHFTESEM